MKDKFIEIDNGELVRLSDITAIYQYTRGNTVRYQIITPYYNTSCSDEVYIRLKQLLPIISLIND